MVALAQFDCAVGITRLRDAGCNPGEFSFPTGLFSRSTDVPVPVTFPTDRGRRAQVSVTVDVSEDSLGDSPHSSRTLVTESD